MPTPSSTSGPNSKVLASSQAAANQKLRICQLKWPASQVPRASLRRA